ncbi:MAG: NAD(P)-dependent oxidoreductase [Oceanospirillaceae bacterium]|jgi:3-hydroxyisobutyrate dehydrogenase|nr:NAD(P)-dependent oxidoreductase [Oceanospirillaceae bacterium]MBT4444131.1 NAD(P)-dependent oxidoreductase [Oceanospirillaceae bacterium]MBT6077439.1 NAD(P)-dependent oxidoreductase [Oceanospirillaceae bacterium]
MKIGFVGLGNVGSKLAGSLLRNGYALMVRDLNDVFVADFVARGATAADTPKQLAQACDLVITCLPSPSACSAVMEGDDGVVAGLSEGKIWLEMSTTDEGEIRRIGDLVKAQGAHPVDCPVSGGCHRADTGNISIFAGCSRETFERALPILTTLGRRVLHTGDLGTASKLKVVTNYLATAHLVALSEALTACKVMGLDMNVSYEAIKASSGNSFVHETESQVILNGSRDINFTVDLVLKDVGLFNTLTEREGMQLDLAPMLVDIFTQAQAQWGPRESSPNIIRRYEEPMGVKVLGSGFPADMIDDEPEEVGYELMAKGRQDG